MANDGKAVAKIRYTHDAMIDIIIANPMISQNQLAAEFGYTPGWVSRVMSSDVFKNRLLERRDELIDPTILATMEERFEALCRQSIDIVQEKLTASKDPDLAIAALGLTSKALGFGARDNKATVVNNFVALMPAKSADSGDWVAGHSPIQGVAVRE